MTVERIDLYKYFNLIRPKGGNGYLNIYLHEVSEEYTKNRLRPAMLVVTGGGYAFLSDGEKEPVALAFMDKDFNAFTLEYSVNTLFPAPLLEGAMAMIYIRENAEKFHVDSNHVGAIGFSAGGHLTAMLGNLFNDKVVIDTFGDKASLCRPDAVVLSYPVITGGEKAHKGSFDNICGDNQKLKDELSIENRVQPTSSPAFIWTTTSDGSVPCENSIYLACAYKTNKVPFEFHMFERGGHGLSLATKAVIAENKAVSKWFELSVTFLRNRGFVVID